MPFLLYHSPVSYTEVMSQHRKSDSKARKEKYTKQFDRTKKNKEKHISLMKKLNSLWPGKKPKAEKGK